MKGTKITDQEGRESIEFSFELRHTPQKVWRALTDPVLLSEWLLPIVELKLERGAAFRLQSPPSSPGWDGAVDCQLLELEPMQKIAYAWTVPFLDTVVTFTLEPTEAGTRLHLVQSGFTVDQKRESGGARYGWNMMTERLFALLDRLA